MTTALCNRFGPAVSPLLALEDFACMSRAARAPRRPPPPEPWWLRYRVGFPPQRRGKWEIRRQVLEYYVPPQSSRLSIKIDGRPMPGFWPGTYTVLIEHDPAEVPFDDIPPKGRVWMSDSPNEIWEQIRAIRRLRGRVLIGGLGLGVMVKAALERPEVESVDVVERDGHIIDLIGPRYSRDPRLRIHHADLMEWKPEARWDVAWFDIWPTVTAANLIQMVELHQRFHPYCGWVGSWCDNWCLRKLAEKCSGLAREFKNWLRDWRLRCDKR